MTKPRTLNDGRIDRTFHDMLGIARTELERIESLYRWRASQLDGRQQIGDAIPGSGSGGGESDRLVGTEAAAERRRQVGHKVAGAKKKLAHVIDDLLPSIEGLLELRSFDPRLDEGPRLADENDPNAKDLDNDERERRRQLGPATLEGGLSAYRGDRKAPKGRPDLQEALDAQRRRLANGQGYGDA